MHYRIKMRLWCFPALNHMLRLLQNNTSTQMKVWQSDAGARAAYPISLPLRAYGGGWQGSSLQLARVHTGVALKSNPSAP